MDKTMPLENEAQFFTKLCDSVGEWSKYNFGDQPTWRPAMGMVEEITEFYSAVNSNNDGEIIDAIGDIVIYMADYYYRRGWDLGKAWDSGKHTHYGPNALSSLVRIAGRICHGHLKGEQGIRGGNELQTERVKEACVSLLETLSSYCIGKYHRSLKDIVSDTWDKVSKRDWKKNPDNAHKIVEAEGGI